MTTHVRSSIYCLPGSYKRVSFLQGFIFTIVFSFGIIGQISLCIQAQWSLQNLKLAEYQPISGELVGFYVSEMFSYIKFSSTEVNY